MQMILCFVHLQVDNDTLSQFGTLGEIDLSYTLIPTKQLYNLFQSVSNSSLGKSHRTRLIKSLAISQQQPSVKNHKSLLISCDKEQTV